MSLRVFGYKAAIIYGCSLLDVPFFADDYQWIVENSPNITMGYYLRRLFRVTSDRTFLNSIVNNTIYLGDDSVRASLTSEWSDNEKQNMEFVISAIGYDPYLDYKMTDQDKKFAYNVLAGYLDDDDIRSDSYKIQAAIQVAQTQVQCNKIDDMINAEFLNTPPNETTITKLITTKKGLLSAVAKLAEDSGIANSNNKGSAGSNTLTKKMKELTVNGFEEIQVNLFDIKTSEAMKQIADLSNQSILDQLSFGANDYIDIIKDQREMIAMLQAELDKLKEDNRNLVNSMSGGSGV